MVERLAHSVKHEVSQVYRLSTKVKTMRFSSFSLTKAMLSISDKNWENLATETINDKHSENEHKTHK